MANKKQKAKTKINADATWTTKVIIALSLIIVAMLVGGLTYISHLRQQTVSFEEQKRLEVFEELARSYVDEAKFSDRDSVNAVYTGTGLSEDNEVYLDFALIDLTDPGSPTTQDGRLHFQWDSERQAWAHAFSYGDVEPLRAEDDEN